MTVLTEWGEELRKEKEAKGIFYADALIDAKTVVIVEHDKNTNIIKACVAVLDDSMVWNFGELVELPTVEGK